MTGHLFKIIYNQRRTNGWIVLELFLIFVLVFVLADFFSVMYLTARKPVGADVNDTYLVRLSMPLPTYPDFISYPEGSEEPLQNFLRITDRIRQCPGVESMCLCQSFYPYSGGYSENSFRHDSLEVNVRIYTATADYFRVFRVYGVNGETPEQLGKAFMGKAVVTRLAAQSLFPGGQQPVGKRIFRSKEDSTGIVIAGVLPDMKPHNYDRVQPYMICPLNETDWRSLPENRLCYSLAICIRIRPGLDKQAFEASFGEAMKADVGNFSFDELVPFSQVREPLMGYLGVTKEIQYRVLLAVFFLLNLFLGVIGTFWFCIEHRREEIGIRMALGASRRKVRQWLLWESLFLFSIALLPALLVCLNLWRMELLSTEYMDLTAGRFLLDVVLALLLLVPVILLATWYPARRSAKIEPAEALHYE